MRRIAHRIGAFTFARMNIVIASVIARGCPSLHRGPLRPAPSPSPFLSVSRVFTAEKSPRVDAEIPRVIFTCSRQRVRGFSGEIKSFRVVVTLGEARMINNGPARADR